MSPYEQKLAEFSQGKKLQRLTRPIRDRADVGCDACGSTQPRSLIILKDLNQGRFHFVGESCLRELMKTGSVLRRFGREPSRLALESELKLRTSTSGSGSKPAPARSPFHEEPTTNPGIGVPLLPAIVLWEREKNYQALVTFLNPQGKVESWGFAREPTSRPGWRRSDTGGFVLDLVHQEPGQAWQSCLNQAWQRATTGLVDPSLTASLQPLISYRGDGRGVLQMIELNLQGEPGPSGLHPAMPLARV